MTGKYAEGTTVSIDTSIIELKRLIQKYGASKFVYGEEAGGYVVMFEMNNRRIRFYLPVPPLTNFEYVGNTYRTRTDKGMRDAQEAEVRRLWRTLILIIKSKFEIVASGITSFETEFLANIVLPDNRTFGEWASPQLEGIYSTGQMPALLPAGR